MRILRHGRLGIVALVALGCSGGPPPPFPQWSKSKPPSAPGVGSATFAVYKTAALQAEALGAKYVNRVVFTPGQRKSVQQLLAPAVIAVRQQTGKPVDFEFIPRPPFTPAPYQKGWRLIGRCLVWDIQSSGPDLDKAITETSQATSFGFGLTGGGATDASLGLTIADEARRAILPRLDEMSADQLDRLASGMQAALFTKPTLQGAIENEHQQMLMGVQAVQDAYVHEDYKQLREKLGNDVRDAITYLQDMHSDDRKRRPAYFEKLAGEADAEASWLSTACLLPAVKRVPETEPKTTEQRPWRKFAKQFFRTCRPMLAMNDATLARTRLLILNCRIMAIMKRTGAAPQELGQFPARVRQDPYSGLPFVYRADGPEFYLYSVGQDFKDDGGQTDETFTTPDLMLEKAKN